MLGIKLSLWSIAAIVAVAVLHFTLSQPVLQRLLASPNDALGAYAWLTYHVANILSLLMWMALATLVLSALYVLMARAVRP